MIIDEAEELERAGGMLQRDNLVRSLGVVELVYRMLNGSSAPGKPADKPKVSLRLLSQYAG